MYYLKRDNAKDFSIDKCKGYDSSAPLAATWYLLLWCIN